MTSTTGRLGPLARMLADYEARHPAPAPRPPRPTKTPAPTEKQVEVLATLRGFIVANGYCPSVRDLAAELGRAVSTVARHLDRLELLGAIERTGKARAIRVLVGVDQVEAAEANTRARTPVPEQPKASKRTRAPVRARPRLRVIETPLPRPVEAPMGVDDFDACNGVD